MRIIDQVKATVLGLTDELVIDGPTGTRAITFENLLKAINQQIGWMSLWGDNIPVEARKNIWRGKNLGSLVTQGQWDAIANGSFKGLFIGDYWEIGGYVWRIMDFDYWLHIGDQSCETYHLVIVPDKTLYTHNMNDANVTTGGYHGSKMYTEGLNQAKTIINGAFGEAHILKHRELLTNAVDSTAGYPTAGAWYDSTVELMNEPMVYGSYIFAPGSTGSATPYRYTIDKTQLAGFRLNPVLIAHYREGYWLRDVVSSSWFARVNYNGNAFYEGASHVRGVRPVFGIKK